MWIWLKIGTDLRKISDAHAGGNRNRKDAAGITINESIAPNLTTTDQELSIIITMRREMRLSFFAFAFFVAASLPVDTESACNVYSALPIRVSIVSTGGANLYFRPHILSPGTIVTNNPALHNYYWYATVSTTTTTGAAIFAAFDDAVKHQTKVLIYGDKSTCPSITADGSIGNVTYLTVNP